MRAWGTGFIPDDESFAAQEWAATWLSVLNHPAVTVLSRPPPTVWYSPSEGPAWRDWLEAAGVDIMPISVSTQSADSERIWLSWIGGQGQPPGIHAARALMAATVPAQTLTNVYVGGSVIVPTVDSAPLHAAVEALADNGVRFGRLTCTSEGDIVSFTAWPAVPEEVIPQLVPACREVLDGSLGCR
jgi:hypothetical protein